MRRACVVCALVLTSCTSSSTTQTVDAPLAIDAHPAIDTAPVIDAHPAIDGTIFIDDVAPIFDAAPAADSPPPPDAPTQTFTLTIDNYLGWCAVTVNTVVYAGPRMFPAGTVVNLHGDTANTLMFVWGFWNGTDHAGNDTMMSTTVTMTASKTVFACCPDIGQSTCP